MGAPLESNHEGSRAFGDLLVSWRGQPSPAGWEVFCDLRLGAAASRLALDARTPRQPFELGDGDSIAWGRLTLLPDADGGFLVLDIDCHSGPASEHSTLLCAWKACDPCGKTPPSEGSKTFGDGGWIKASWTIAGADQACLAARLKIILAGGDDGDAATLSPQNPVWRKTLRVEEGHTELAFILSVSDNGDARIDAVVRHARLPGEHAELDRFPLEPQPPGPHPEPEPAPGNGVAFGRPREFASFTYPRSLLPPTPDQQARRFAATANSGGFQQNLGTLAQQKNRAGMVAEAEEFVAQPSSKYPGQYVSRIADLPGPMGRLEGPPVRALLAMRPQNAEQLRAALAALLGVPVDAFLSQPDYPAQRAQLQDSLLALLITGSPLGDHEDALTQALLVCHVAELLQQQPGLLTTPETLREPLEANPLPPPALLPLPAAAAAAPKGYAKPLGFADLQVIKQRLLRYRLGEIAHVENVMRGESKERSEQRSRRVETRERDYDDTADAEMREQDYQGRSRSGQESVTHTLKREFDNLKQEYGSDGLSVTVTGSWTDTPLDPATLKPGTLGQDAAAYARRLLDRASARVARRVEAERSRRSVEEFAEQNRRRFGNEGGDGHLTGIYRWLDEIHLAHLEHRGSRLIVEIVVADPAADYVRRNNVLHGIAFTAPIPPWQGGDGIAPVRSAKDIDRQNYAALADRYNATDMPPPPPQDLVLSAALASDPPHAQAKLDIPDGYAVSGGTVGYGWTGTAPAGTAQSLDFLVGGTAVKVDPGQDPNPGAKSLTALPAGTTAVPVTAVAAGLEYAATITLACACSATADAYLRWQIAAYGSVMAAYRARRDDYFGAMAKLAAGPSRSAPERRRETERAELQKAAIRCLMAPFLGQPDPAPPAWQRDAAALTLIPFFRDALEWGEMTYALYGRYFDSSDPDRPDWLTLAQAAGSAPDFLEFLEAGAARLLVPVKPPQVLPLLYYLASAGQFWNGAPELAPVHAADVGLVNTLKSLAHIPPPPRGETWEVEVATSMLMLQPDASLPAPDGGAEP